MIEIKDLSIRYEDGTAIAYHDRVFESGKSYVLLGASGCGKSTLLNMIAGVLTPTTGKVIMDGVEVSALKQKQKDAMRIRNIGYIFQDFKLIDDMTVADNLSVLAIEGVDLKDTDTILDKLGILKHKRRRVKKLSGGEKQRVAIARALVKHPDLILADEPTGNLNYEIGYAIMQELLREARGKTLLCVTHDDRLAGLFDETVYMNDVAYVPEGGQQK